MKNNFFTYKGIEYVLVFENQRLKFLKKENESSKELNSSEASELIDFLNNKNGYQYDSIKLTEIIRENKELNNKEYLINFLEWLENIIPIDNRENFYNNLKTLKSNLNLDIDFSKMSEETSNFYQRGGNYNTRENSIIMDENSMVRIWNIAKLTNNPQEFFWKTYSQSLLHELAHMASSNYNQETKVSLCGFDTFPAKDESEKNRGLTEGFTEIIAMAGVPDNFEISSGYYIEASLINQLIQIIGLDVFLKSYFSNLGTKLLEQELCKLIDNQVLAFQLFRCIEVNYQIKDIHGKQSILGNIQLLLLDYLEKKCEKLLENADYKSINSILPIYEQMLITPEKLQIMKKNASDYKGIEESLEKFKRIQEQFSQVEEIKTSI